MLATEQIVEQIGKRTSVLNKVVTVFMPIGLAIGGVLWYFNNVWKPSVKLIQVDFSSNIATLNINGTDRILYAGSTLNARFGWGVRFAGSEFNNYDRIELVKNELTYKTIIAKN